MDKLTVRNIFSYMIEDVKESYSDEKRFFHNLEHLHLGYEDINEYADWYVSNVSKDPQDTGICMEQIAAWLYHDIVYSVRDASLNERRSADIAKEKLKDSDLNIELVERIILDTQKHIANIEESKLILDIDMASLGYEYDKFLFYRKKALKEYATIFPENLLIEGVLKFIDATLKNDSIYHLEYFKNKYEKRAKDNLNRYKNEILESKKSILEI